MSCPESERHGTRKVAMCSGTFSSWDGKIARVKHTPRSSLDFLQQGDWIARESA